MQYFLLNQNSNVVNPIKFVDPPIQGITMQMSHEDYESIKMGVLHFDVTQEYEMPDILVSPTFLVSDAVKQVLHMYDRGIKFKPIQTLPFSSEQISADLPIYWVCDCTHLNCLHPSTIILPNGEMENITLDHARTQEMDVFRISDMKSNRLVVSLAVAESLLRRDMYGIGLKPLKII